MWEVSVERFLFEHTAELLTRNPLLSESTYHTQTQIPATQKQSSVAEWVTREPPAGGIWCRSALEK